MRQIVLDTETTGLEVSQGHRIIEIGGVELINRRLTHKHFHRYLQPDREIDEGAMEVHGITNEFLEDKPRFADVADEFIRFVEGAELVIHNAPFDIGFLNSELALLGSDYPRIEEICSVVDSLALARHKHPGQKNNLDALCKRYQVDNSQRELHGALLDSEILADVYLAMTGGQTSLSWEADEATPMNSSNTEVSNTVANDDKRSPLRVIRASAEELSAHQQRLEAIEAQSGQCLWLQDNS